MLPKVFRAILILGGEIIFIAAMRLNLTQCVILGVAIGVVWGAMESRIDRKKREQEIERGEPRG